MSGIYGIYQYDGAPVTSQTMDRMSEAMAFYGPHGGGCKVEGSLGLGHLLLEVNPEDAFEKQPMRCARGPAVSAARLDNRTALLDAFKVPESEASQLSDGHLVSLAFDRWGEDLCSHLQGDWALAAWDARERRLLLARDACGSSTLYCYEGNGFIAFASSMKALLTLPGVVREPDRLRLAQVLVSWQHDAQLTAYKGFQRLVWAHAMTVGSDGQTRIWRHWSPEGRGLLNYRRDAEYEEAFLEHYTRAVQSCLRTQRPVAATLSGGRGSGSVVSLAAPLLGSQGRGLTAYTSVPCLPPDGARKQRFGNEWEMAHATATMAGENVQHVAIDAANYGVIQGVEYLLDTHDGPGHAPSNQYWLKAINDAVSQGGAGALLTGQFGNAAVSWSGNGSALLALLQGESCSCFAAVSSWRAESLAYAQAAGAEAIADAGAASFSTSQISPQRLAGLFRAQHSHGRRGGSEWPDARGGVRSNIHIFTSRECSTPLFLACLWPWVRYWGGAGGQAFFFIP